MVDGGVGFGGPALEVNVQVFRFAECRCKRRLVDERLAIRARADVQILRTVQRYRMRGNLFEQRAIVPPQAGIECDIGVEQIRLAHQRLDHEQASDRPQLHNYCLEEHACSFVTHVTLKLQRVQR